MQRRRAKRRAPMRPRTASRPEYHHGNLRAALIEAAVALVEEGGPEKVTVREAARRAGVSPGAPFRHFRSRTALMTAVAEQASERFRQEIADTLSKVAGDDPLARLRAIGDAYFRWVTRHPTHFRVVSERGLIDFAGSEALRGDNEAIRGLMQELLEEAERQGLLRSDDVGTMALAARALSYGMGRMYIDGHFAQWDVAEENVSAAFKAVFDLFFAGLRAEERTPSPSASPMRS